MIYHAHIREHPKRDGRFVTSMAGLVVVSSDPEHDLCHAMTQAGLPDGPIQFWRDWQRTLWHPSVHRMGRQRITLGESFPKRFKRTEDRAGIAARTGKHHAQTAETDASGGVVAGDT